MRTRILTKRVPRTFTRVAAVACALFLAAGWLVTAGERRAPAAASGFQQSGIAGGGFVNVIAADPSGSGLLIAGGDVSGLHRSTDLRHIGHGRTLIQRLSKCLLLHGLID